MTNPYIGSAHVAGDYNVPNDGQQFTNGCNEIFTRGFTVLKIYATGAYLTDYPLQSAWSSVPTNLSQLVATTQYATQIARFSKVVFTAFTFANGTTNWWRVDPSNAKMAAEYTEIYNLAVYLLTTYNGQGKEFILQNWEGDWAFMDSTTVDTYVPRKMVDYYAAFLGTRQRAIQDARRDTASDCTILHAYEANRALDARELPHLRRILKDIAPRIQPDIISYSAYDSTIVEQGGWGASYAAWLAATTPVFQKALRQIQLCFPGVPIQIGEFGYPETEAPVGRNCGDMCTATYAIFQPITGARNFIYWEVFDNEAPRGYYIVKSDGSTSDSGLAMEALATA